MSDTYTAEPPVADTAPPPSLEQKVTSELAGVQRDKVAATDAIISDVTAAQNRMLPRIEKLANTVGVEAENLKPWDADKEQAKHKTDPIEAFGSLGSVFGILASAFTNQPMANSLNASAAAMMAIKDNDDQAYNRAYKAWQDNANMAVQRHNIQHTAYQDAVSLLNVNMQAANAKLALTAARFGDKQVQTLLENGMSKEVVDLLNARQKMSLELQQQMPKIMLENERMDDLLKDPAYKNSPVGSPERAAAIKAHAERWRGQSASADEIWTTRWVQENPNGTSADFARDYATYAQTAKSQRVPKPEEAELNRRIAEKTAAGMSPGQAFEEAKREVQLAEKQVPTANRLDDLNSRIDRTKYVLATMNKVDELLLKHNAITGIGGTLTRPAEAIKNILGSNETDRSQFRRYVLEIQEMAPRLINDSGGRPLSSEAAKINGIIAGLQPGDTGANTIRAYVELRTLFNDILRDFEKRRAGGAAPASAPAAPPATGSWDKYPVVQ